MPIHDVGYRTWKGKLTATWSRWLTITEVGVRSAFTSRWIRRIVLASWFPVIYFGVMFFVFEQMMESSSQQLMNNLPGVNVSEIMEHPDAAENESANSGSQDTPSNQPDTMVERIGGAVGEAIEEGKGEAKYGLQKKAVVSSPMINQLPNGEALAAALESGDESTFRHTVWSYLLSTFLRYSQGFMTLMVVGLIVPPLISRDVRSRAFLLYYSRPITRMEYLMGKVAIPGFILMLITIAPALVLYFVGLMLSPNLNVVVDTWDLPIRILLATAVCVIPTCLIGLLFSSLTQESRFASFAWFTVWGLGAVVWMGIYMSNSQGGALPYDSNWSLISIYSTIGRVQSWLFGLEPDMSAVIPSLITLVLISLFSFLLLYRRVSAPIRI